MLFICTLPKKSLTSNRIFKLYNVYPGPSSFRHKKAFAPPNGQFHHRKSFIIFSFFFNAVFFELQFQICFVHELSAITKAFLVLRTEFYEP